MTEATINNEGQTRTATQAGTVSLQTRLNDRKRDLQNQIEFANSQLRVINEAVDAREKDTRIDEHFDLLRRAGV